MKLPTLDLLETINLNFNCQFLIKIKALPISFLYMKNTITVFYCLCNNTSGRTTREDN